MSVPAVLSPKQQRSIAEATARINLWHGAVRSGKTLASIICWLHFVATAPPGPLLIVGKTKDTVERNVFGPMYELLGPLARTAISHTAGANTAVIFGRTVYVVGANDAKAETRIRGLTLVGAYVDEASLVPEAFWAMLLTRLSVSGARLFATTNPDSPVHWLKRDYLAREGGLDMRSWHFELVDNPSLDPAFVAELRKTFVGLWFKRFILGLWVLAEGAIYDTFDPTPGGPHVVTELPRDDGGRLAVDSWTLSIDYGTTNPFVALLCGIGTGRDGQDRLYVAQEWRWDSRQQMRQLTDAEYSTRLRQWIDVDLRADLGQAIDLEGVYVDPSAASFVAQLWRDSWPGVHGADNAVLDGIRSVSSLLAADRLKIHESCTEGIAEKSAYVWDEEAVKRGDEKPLKVADHFPDAERYGVAAMRRHWRHWLAVDLPDAA